MSKKFLFLAIFSISLLQASNALALAPVPECQAGCSYKLNAIGISRSQNNVLDFPLELDSANTSNINTLLGADRSYTNALAIKPGEKLAISWNIANEPTNANYSVSYGCSNTISGIKETTKIADTNEYPIFWTTPNNGNCYCRVWIRMKNGTRIIAGAMSRPFDICGNNKTITPFSNPIPFATSSQLTYTSTTERVGGNAVNPRNFKITTEITPSIDCKVGHAKITYMLLGDTQIKSIGAAITYENGNYPYITSTDNPPMTGWNNDNTSLTSWNHCPNEASSTNEWPNCAIDPNVEYSFKTDIRLDKIQSTNKTVFTNVWKGDPVEVCEVIVPDINNSLTPEMDCPVITFQCPATATTESSSSIKVVTEKGSYNTTTNTMSASFSIWPLTKQDEDVDWKLEYYMVDENEAAQSILNRSGEKFIKYINGNHWVNVVIDGLEPLKEKKRWCFMPFAKLKREGTDEFVSHGQELCFPKDPWIVTRMPGSDKDYPVVYLNGAITNFSGSKKIDTWFEIISPDGKVVKRSATTTINSISPMPKFGAIFSKPLAVIIDWVNYFYRACGKGDGDAGSENCGDFYKIFDPSWLVVSTTPFTTQGNATTYNGIMKPFDNQVKCYFKLFPKTGGGGSIIKGPISPNNNGKFFIKDSSLVFKNSKYCYTAYCSLYGVEYKDRFAICGDGTKKRISY